MRLRQPAIAGMFPDGLSPAPEVAFDGPAYVPAQDYVRLSGQLERIRTLMADGQWRTLAEIAAKVQAPEASCSANLRHLRKSKHGAHDVQRRHRGDVSMGLYEYSVRR